MKKKFLSILLCLCMVMALLPTTAMAGTYEDDSYKFLVRVADHAFNADATEVSYWTCSDNALTSTTSESAWNVKYDPTGSTPTVTLKNFNYTGDQNAIRSQDDLNIIFEGTNNIDNNNDTDSSDVASFERNGIMVKGNLTITGSSGATLAVTSEKGNAIEANDFAAENDTRYDEKITINNANITATGYGLGIGSTQDLIITNSTINSTGSLYHGLQGGFYDTKSSFGNDGSITITNSTITAASTSGTAINIEPTFTGNYLWKANEADEWQTLSADSKPAYSTATKVLLTPGVTYAYAYDARRVPAFPDYVGAELKADSFNKPVKYDSSTNSHTYYDSNEGPWTLTEVGCYADFVPLASERLESIVTSVANKYGLDEDGKNALLIHELTDADGKHVAYGVVIAVDETNGYAMFVGDLWNDSGAGYLLSNNQITTSPITFNAQKTAQTTYSVNLSPTTVSFEADSDYSDLTPQTITVTNTGDAATGELTVALSGMDANQFKLSKTSITDIALGDSDTFTVVPNNNLAKGTYTATVTVKNGKVMPVTATVNFTVKEHVHGNWSYAYDDNTNKLTATCGNPNCTLSESSVSLDVNVSTTTPYKSSGYSCPVTVATTSAWTSAGLVAPTITDNGLTQNTLKGTATITVGGKVVNYGTVEYTLQKGTLTATDFTFAAPSNLTYDGSGKHAGVTLKRSDPHLGSMTVKYYKGEDEFDAPTDVGTYTVKISINANTYYNAVSDLTAESWKFTITPKDIADVTAGSIPDQTYTGIAITLDNVPLTYNDQTLTKGTDYTIESYQNNTAAGEATVTVTGTGNYTGTKDIKFQIKKADMTGITAEGYTGTYDGSAHGITVHVPDEYAGATVTYGDSADNCTESSLTYTNAGEYTVYYKVSKANYNDVTGSAKVTIAQAEATMPTLSGTYTYNGEEQTATLNGVESYMTVTGNKQTNAGSYTITVDLDTNHKWKDGANGSINWTIEKAPVTVTAKDLNIYVNNTVPDLTNPEKDTHYTVVGFLGNETIDGITMDYAENIDNSVVGTYEIIIDGPQVDASGNYAITYTVGTLTISARSASTGSTYRIESKVTDATNGSISLSNDIAKKGDTITVTVTPEQNYEVQSVTVMDKNGNEIAVTDNGDGTFTFKMPAANVTVDATFVEIAKPVVNPFTDVDSNDYFYNAVLWAVKMGITNGTDDGTTFSPNDGCTRAQMVTFLWRAVGSPEPTTNVCAYTDVDPDSYYHKAVQWAVENGITKGTSATTFSPDMECTRAQMAAFLCRMADGKAVSNTIGFTDVSADAYYAESVQWAVENGITLGTGDGTTFSPNEICTRAQMVTFLYRFFVK